MADIIESVREKAHAKGFTEGVLAERLQTINLLSRISGAPNVEAALFAEHRRLEALQATEVSAMHAPSSGGTAFDDTAFEAQHALIARTSARGGALPGAGVPLDNEDKVAAAMGLTAAPRTPASASPSSAKPAGAGCQPQDDMDKVAAAMGL